VSPNTVQRVVGDVGGELAASQAAAAKCPGCGALVRLQPRQRDVNSVDGDTTLQELVGDCPRCRKSFFPAT
jgi:hypothetical protein